MVKIQPPVRIDRTCPQCRSDGARILDAADSLMRLRCDVCGCSWNEPDRRKTPRRPAKGRR